MQSLQIRWPVAATIGLSIVIIASAPTETPSDLSFWNSEMRSSSGHPANGTPNTVFLNGGAPPSAGAFSFRPCEQESRPCSWHQMQ